MIVESDTMEEVKKTSQVKRVSLGVGGVLVQHPDEPKRGAWANQIEFILSCIGYAVGIGNVWRFPLFIYRNGGGAFLIPFIIMLITMGLPIFFLELCMGQYTKLGPIKAFSRMAPAFHGLGHCTLVVIFFVLIYYMIIVAWTLFYTFASFSSKLAWAYCDNDFNTNDCYSSLQNTECQDTDKTLIFYNKSCMAFQEVCSSLGFNNGNTTHCWSGSEIKLISELYTRVLSSEEYFRDYVLGLRGATWENFGGIRWELLGCLTLAWIVCFLCLVRGIQTIGKVVYFTALFPYVILTILLVRGILITAKNVTTCLSDQTGKIPVTIVRRSRLRLKLAEFETLHYLTWDATTTCIMVAIRLCMWHVLQSSSARTGNSTMIEGDNFVGVTLEGSDYGMLWYIKPNFSKLKDANVWADAASQIFYSLGIACGSLVTLASYSNFSNNCHRDAILVTCTNLFTSVFAGLVIFSILGFLAEQMKMPIENVVQSAEGLAFIAYPEAVVQMPWSNLWAILFFFMLFILGLGSQFAGVQAINTAILDNHPDLRKYESLVVLAICATCWLLAIPMVFDGGIYLFKLMDWHTASWAILLIGFAELIVASWFYGCNRFLGNLAEMKMKFGHFLRGYWWLSWVVLAPVTCLGVFGYQLDQTDFRGSYGSYEFPVWAGAIGIGIGLATLAPLPIFFILQLWKAKAHLSNGMKGVNLSEKSSS